MSRFLLLHAFPLDGSMWERVAVLLRAEGHDVMTPDLRGFGDAPLGSAAPGIEVMVTDVLAMMGDEPAVIVGCSMGGYVALGIARRRPDLVAALALVDTKATADPEAARAHRERVAVLAESGGDWAAGMIDGLLGDTTRRGRPAVVSAVARALLDTSRDTVAWAQRAMAARPDSRATLGLLTCPVLVVMGEEDTMSPLPEQEAILEASPQSMLVVIPGAGHLTPCEAPDEVAEALVGLLARSR